MNEEKREIENGFTDANVKIVRGIYLTGVGQEEQPFYFKLGRDHEDFEKIDEGMVCLTFYQQENFVTAIPAIIRVAKVITNFTPLREAYRMEITKGYPLVPIIQVFEAFDISYLMKIVEAGERYERSVRELKTKKSINEKSHYPMKGEFFEQMELF